MLKRKEFNAKAKQLLADDDLRGLNVLAGGLVTERPVAKGHWTEELQQILATAVTEAAQEWWKHGGNCHKKVCAAISNAARDFRGRGGYRADNTWRGGYSTDARKFGSQLFDDKAAVKLAETMEGADAAAEVSESAETDDRDQRDAQRERLTEFTREHALERTGERQADKTGEAPEERIFTGTGMLEAGAERVDHDGGHADDVRLNPKDDGEAGHGVEGAVRGLNTGRPILDAWWIAWEKALGAESQQDRAYIAACDKAGGFENWVNKDGNRKRARAHHEARYRKIRRGVLARARATMDAEVAPQIVQAKYLAESAPAGGTSPDRAPDLNVYTPAPPARSWGVGLDAFEPITVWADKNGYFKITVSGDVPADQASQFRNLRRWKQAQGGRTWICLFDMFGQGVEVVTLKVRPPGSDLLLMPERTRVSLLDV